MLSAFDKNTSDDKHVAASMVHLQYETRFGRRSERGGWQNRVRSSSVPRARPPLLAALAHVERERERELHAGAGSVCGPSYAALGQDVRDLGFLDRWCVCGGEKACVWPALRFPRRLACRCCMSMPVEYPQGVEYLMYLQMAEPPSLWLVWLWSSQQQHHHLPPFFMPSSPSTHRIPLTPHTP